MKKIETKEEMSAWLSKSKEGDRAEYYRGFLYTDRNTTGYDREKLRVADMAWSAYEQSRATLMQKRNGPDDYSYIIESFGLGPRLVAVK